MTKTIFHFPRFNEKGASLALVLAILGILLSATLGLSAVLFNQAEMMKGIGDSVFAFYAADTGIEKALTDEESPQSSYGPTDVEGAIYEVEVVCCAWNDPSCHWDSGECPGLAERSDCEAYYYCYWSIGTARGTKRAIEITR